MKRNYIILLFVLFYGINGFSQIIDNTIDDPGDIVIIAYHNDPDGFSFVFLDNCPNGTSIRFIDEEWNGSAFASAAYEGEVLWTNNTGNTIIIGTVISIENADNDATINASIGIASEDDSGFNLSLTGDGVIAVTGTRASPEKFLAFFGDTSDSSLTGTSLVNGATANQNTSYGAGYYSGATDCSGISIENCATQLNTKENWTITNTYSYPSAVISAINFGVLNKNYISKKDPLLIFPTIVTDDLNIQATQKFQKISLFNTLGTPVIFNTVNTKSMKINLSNLTSGVYYLKIEFPDKRVVKRIVKK